MKILIGPKEIAGFANAIKHGASKENIEINSIDFDCHKFKYSSDAKSDALTELTSKIISLSDNSEIASFVLLKLKCKWLLQCIFFIVSLFIYDSYVYIWASYYLPFGIDLKILKFLRKKIIFIHLGSDTRPLAINGAAHIHFCDQNLLVNIAKYKMMSKKQIKNVRMIEKYADIIITSPLSSQINKRACVNWFQLGFPIIQQSTMPDMPPLLDGLRILHAPSARHYKGSEEIKRVIDELISEGYKINYKEIAGVSNAIVLQEIVKSHIILDELYSDTGLAGLGSEAAALGRVVLVGGYGWQCLKDYTPNSYQFPSITFEPANLKQTLIRILNNTSHVQETAKCHYQFVKHNWASNIVAKKLYDWIVNGVPDECYFDPSKVTYITGIGADIKSMKKVVAQIIQQCNYEEIGIVHPCAQREFKKLFATT